MVQDDDLGALAASFNRMQAGLAERQRLQAAFGTYVDPALAARLLEQGDDIFTGERREVTVMFVDIRDFTPFAEANTAEDTVARLNALFEIVVPAVVDAGGHVNKFLGDGALAVFGAPNDLADHADAAVSAAVLIHRLVAERFGGELRIGIGINTGVVIAGTIGGGGKLEFTLIGDTVNVAARVEQLTKTTGDTILLTHQTVDALVSRPPGLIDRGSHALKGKSALCRSSASNSGTTSVRGRHHPGDVRRRGPDRVEGRLDAGIAPQSCRPPADISVASRGVEPISRYVCPLTVSDNDLVAATRSELVQSSRGASTFA